jgi:hypothetical protein
VFATIFQHWFSSGCERAVPYRILPVFAAIFIGAGPSSAGELTELNVNEQDGVYRIRMEMHVDAPATHVYAALTDFAHISRLNPAITRSDTLPSQIPGVTRVRTLIEDCILAYCVSISRVEEIREGRPGHLHVETDPRQSDFKSGSAHWWIRPQGAGSMIIYEAAMEPDFFLPPLVGRVFMKRGLREGILETFENLERIASLDARMAEQSLVAYGMTEH